MGNRNSRPATDADPPSRDSNNDDSKDSDFNRPVLKVTPPTESSLDIVWTDAKEAQSPVASKEVVDEPHEDSTAASEAKDSKAGAATEEASKTVATSATQSPLVAHDPSISITDATNKSDQATPDITKEQQAEGTRATTQDPSAAQQPADEQPFATQNDPAKQAAIVSPDVDNNERQANDVDVNNAPIEGGDDVKPQTVALDKGTIQDGKTMKGDAADARAADANDVWHNCADSDDGKVSAPVGEDVEQTKASAIVGGADDKEVLTKETATSQEVLTKETGASNDETQPAASDCFVDSEGNELHAIHVIFEKKSEQPATPEGTAVLQDASLPGHFTGTTNDDNAQQPLHSHCLVDSEGNELRAIHVRIFEKEPQQPATTEGNAVLPDTPPGETTCTSHDDTLQQPPTSDCFFDADGNELRTIYAQVVEHTSQQPIASDCIVDSEGNELHPIFVEIVEHEVVEHHVVEYDGDHPNAPHETVQVEIVETVQHEVGHYHLSEPTDAEPVTETNLAKDAEGVEDVELAKDAKDVKDSKDSKDVKDAQDVKDVKDSKDTKGSKVPPIDTSVASLLTSDGLPALSIADTGSVGYLNAEAKPSCMCPLSHKTLENAHRSSTCGHLYSYTPVMEYVLSFPVVGAPCPVVGCPATINVMSLIPDEEAQAAADVTTAENKQAEAATWSAAHVVE